MRQRRNKPQYAHFADKLRAHARVEEEVLYAAAILIGEYLKLKLGVAPMREKPGVKAS